VRQRRENLFHQK
jgi:hypothetical protein